LEISNLSQMTDVVAGFQTIAADSNGYIWRYGRYSPKTHERVWGEGGIGYFNLFSRVEEVPLETIYIRWWVEPVGQYNTQKLWWDLTPENTTQRDITWSSSDTNIATVDADGVVTGRNLGTATITATGYGKTATRIITVVESTSTPIPSPTVSPTPTLATTPTPTLTTPIITSTLTATITTTSTVLPPSTPVLVPTPTQTKSITPPPKIYGDANCDDLININDILFVRDVIFGEKDLSPQGRLNLKLGPDDDIKIDSILYIRDVIFGNTD